MPTPLRADPADRFRVLEVPASKGPMLIFGAVPVFLLGTIAYGILAGRKFGSLDDFEMLAFFLAILALDIAIFSIYRITFDGVRVTYRTILGSKSIALSDVANAHITSDLRRKEGKAPFRLVFIGKRSPKPILEINIKPARDPEFPEFLRWLDTELAALGVRTDLTHARRQVFRYKQSGQLDTDGSGPPKR